ncbi:MAG: sulfatase [Candidatus Micrarchaeota archaeon]|nr:sulfatase [Candidatus Micrarchaeota archaeon]
MRKPNVIIIVCDTLRKDIIDLYGGPARMPNLGTFAKDSIVYDNAIAPAPWTFPSHVSLFTGLYPSEHGIHETKKMKMPQIVEAHLRSRHQTIAEYLHGMGYSTIGVSANLMISKVTGFDRGFDDFFTFTHSPWIQSDIATQARNLGADMAQVAAMLMKRGDAKSIAKYGVEYLKIKLKERAMNYPLKKGAEVVNRKAESMVRKKPFFLFLNYYEAHEPYKGFSDKETQDHLTGVKAISREKVERLKHQYVLEAEYLDSELGRLMDWLKRKRLYDDSLIILTSDHGQAFNEHGFMYHGIYVYDEVVRVPMVIKYPENKKHKKSHGYQSLVGVFGLVRSVVNGEVADITSESAFAESFGNAEFFPESYKHRMWYVERNYERLRKAVYADGFKLDVDGSEGRVVEFLSGSKPASQKKQKREFAKLIGTLKKSSKGGKFILPKA